MKYEFISKDDPEYEQVVKLRYDTFFKPYNLGWENIYDELEENAIHLVCTNGDEVVGYGRLNFDDKDAVVSQMVVKEGFQKRGIGTSILEKLIMFSLNKGEDKVVLSAKVGAIKFYERIGFILDSEVYPSKKTGLPHIRMIKNLSV